MDMHIAIIPLGLLFVAEPVSDLASHATGHSCDALPLLSALVRVEGSKKYD